MEQITEQWLNDIDRDLPSSCWMEDLAEFYKNISIGSVVFDNLTQEIHRVVRIRYDIFGNQGIYLDSDAWLGGGRFPWELSPPPPENIACK